MKKTLILLLAAGLTVQGLHAQETYTDATIASQDLNGTARYVGMGGAMDALGADISTISSNPAGIGLFRSNTASVSLGGVSQPSGGDTKMSFDQIGLVWSTRLADNSFVNLAFNYHKNANFNSKLNAGGALSNSSLNKLTYIKGDAGYLFDNDGKEYITCTRLDELIADNVLLESDNVYRFKEATGYQYLRKQSGYVGTYDFNISGNLNNRLYLGLTIGVYDLHYNSTTSYSETLEANAMGLTSMDIVDERHISGVGADIKVGVIYRPIEGSPFRVGLSLASPVFYDLDSESTLASPVFYDLNSYSQTSFGPKYVRSGYEYKVYTPWRVGLSVGHTIGTNVALGAVYEFADYSHIDNRIEDWDYYDASSKDGDMNRHTRETLKGVSTLKLGAEIKLMPELALRVGYNYVSPMFDKNAAKGVYKNGSLVESPGIFYSSTADYTNWLDTHRFTCGLGYTMKKLTLDVAYQHSLQNGEFHPFMNYYDDQAADMNNTAALVNVKNKRNQLLFTIGYKF